ncbi:MAG: hypothetical protein K2R98_23720 [Gemmataceae bacterium]|nr:hypothetical protein [Gemmataceae bacterium]
MKLAELQPATIERIKKLLYDRIIEKHEGPERWTWLLFHDGADFLFIDGKYVLLPVPKDHHKNITVLRSFTGASGDSLVLFLKDTAFVREPRNEDSMAGFIAICDRLPGEDFFVAIVYHEWFISAGYKLA